MVSDCKYIFLEYLGAVDGRREEAKDALLVDYYRNCLITAVE
jgi:hypothetical protein